MFPIKKLFFIQFDKVSLPLIFNLFLQLAYHSLISLFSVSNGAKISLKKVRWKIFAIKLLIIKDKSLGQVTNDSVQLMKTFKNISGGGGGGGRGEKEKLKL